MASPKEIAIAFADEASKIDGIRAALHFEPAQLPTLPCVTLLAVQIQQEENQTGPATENLWGWNVYLYIPLGGRVAGDDYEGAQDDLYELVPPLLAIVRRNPELDDTCLKATIADLGGEPDFDEENGALVKTLRLTARTEET